VASNTYKPPTIFDEIPTIENGNGFYSPTYIKVDDKYIVGGHFPEYYTYNMISYDTETTNQEPNRVPYPVYFELTGKPSKSSADLTLDRIQGTDIVGENYSRDQLVELAGIYGVDIIDESYELWKNIMLIVVGNSGKQVITEKLVYNPSNAIDYIQTHEVNIHYVMRPRSGIPDPGEIYNVTLDPKKKYAVPFKFSNYIAVYSSVLKEQVDNGYIILEGPAIFEDTTPENKLTSSYYIFVKYSDERGRQKLFREGVGKKSIIHSKTLDTCNRFKNQQDCDASGSRSIDQGKEKVRDKCGWVVNKVENATISKCASIKETEDFEKNYPTFNVGAVKYADFKRNKSWQEAFDKSIRYVEQMTLIGKMSEKETISLSRAQKYKLFKFKEHLDRSENPIKMLTISELSHNKDTNKRYFEIPVSKVFEVVDEEIDSEYMTISLLKKEMKEHKFPLRIIVGKEHLVDGELVVIDKIDYQTGKVLVMSSGGELELPIEMFRRSSPELIEVVTSYYAKIKKTDHSLLSEGVKGFRWNLESHEYILNNAEVSRRTINTYENYVHRMLIKPTKEMDSLPLITRDDIIRAMEEMSFSTYKETDYGSIELVDAFPATVEAKRQAIMSNVDIDKLRDSVIGIITMTDVVGKSENKQAGISIAFDAITEKLTDGINNSNVPQLKKFLRIAKEKKFLNKQLMEEASKKIKETSTPKTEPVAEEVPIQTPKPIVKSARGMYTVRPRRN